MAMHQWKGRTIAHSDHHQDLEAAAAAHEFGVTRLDRAAAEEAAYKAYKFKHHGDAIQHHLKGMRAAVSQGRRDDGERHNALYNLHMKALGMRPGSMPPGHLDQQQPHADASKFSSHPADHLLLGGKMTKSERDDFFKNVDSDALYLSEPDADPTLAKSLSSPMSLDQLHGQRVRVYFNLHNRLFSVQHKGRVVAHVPEVSLEDVNFRVNEAGRQRVLEEQRKNVHAFVEGKFKHVPEGDIPMLPHGVKYNPYKYESFVRAHDETPIFAAKAATLKNLPHPLVTVQEEPVQTADEGSWINTKRKRNG